VSDVHAEMTHTFHVCSKTSESESWVIDKRGLAGSVRMLSPDGARRETTGGDVSGPAASHVIRMTEEAVDYVKAGLRLVDDKVNDDGTNDEYVVIVARWRDHIQPGNLRVTVAKATAATV